MWRARVTPDGGGDRERMQMEAARKDASQFAPIFDRYIEPVYRFCLLRLWNREQAEDAASQTFVKALSALDEYRGGSVPAWIFAIARTTIIDIQRRRLIEETRATAVDANTSPPSPETTLLADEDVRWLYSALDCLTDSQRQVVTLRLAGLTSVEIAASTGRTPGGVRALQFRAVAELKRLHEQESTNWQVRDE
jgi:RNA polymerase sigma-70 factor, ECF subfamily